MQANGVIFQVRVKGRDRLTPVLLMIDRPNEALEIMSTVDGLYDDLGCDRVAIVDVIPGDVGRISIKRVADVAVFKEGDSTTSKRAIDIVVRDGALGKFISTALERE